MSRRHCGKKVGEGRGKRYVSYKSKYDQDIPKCIIIRNFHMTSLIVLPTIVYT